MYSRVAQTKRLQLSISEIPSGHLKKKKKNLAQKQITTFISILNTVQDVNFK